MLTDIYQKIEVDFGTQAALAHQALDELDARTKGLISPRLTRAIIFISNGDIQALKKNIELARKDWRDVLLQAEYSYPDNIRVRNFEKTFHELKLIEKRT